MYAVLFVNVTILIVIGLFQTFVLLKLSLKSREHFRVIEHRIVDVFHWIYFDRTLKPSIPLPKPVDWCATTDFLVEISRLLHIHKPRLVVELGSGLSTLIIGLTLKHLGTGGLISIDHDEEYANKSRSMVTANDLDEIVTVRSATIAPNTNHAGAEVWYNTEQLNNLYAIDMLIVDGPPAGFGANVRETALYYFWDRLAPGGLIVLDDADRHGERTAIENIKTSLRSAIDVQYLPTERGMAILRKQPPTRSTLQNE